MNVIQDFIQKINNDDASSIELIHSISKEIEDRKYHEFDDALIGDVELVTYEDLIFGNMVVYQHRSKIILAKSKDGKDVEERINEMHIISISEPLSGKILPLEQSSSHFDKIISFISNKRN